MCQIYSCSKHLYFKKKQPVYLFVVWDTLFEINSGPVSPITCSNSHHFPKVWFLSFWNHLHIPYFFMGIKNRENPWRTRRKSNLLTIQGQGKSSTIGSKCYQIELMNLHRIAVSPCGVVKQLSILVDAFELMNIYIYIDNLPKHKSPWVIHEIWKCHMFLMFLEDALFFLIVCFSTVFFQRTRVPKVQVFFCEFAVGNQFPRIAQKKTQKKTSVDGAFVCEISQDICCFGKADNSQPTCSNAILASFAEVKIICVRKPSHLQRG